MYSGPYKFLFSIFLILISSFIFAISLGWTDPLYYLNDILLNVGQPVILGILGAFGILFGLFLLKTSFNKRMPSQTDVIETSLGQVKITISALEKMSEKITKQTMGVKEAKTKVKCTPNGVAVFLEVSVAPDVNIPDVTAEIQTKINDYFIHKTGIQVEEVRVLVSNMVKETKSRVE